MAAPTDTVVKGKGFDTRVLRRGAGEKLLFLHGAAGANWTKFHDDLAERYDVMITEHPGFGESADLPHVANVTDLANHYRQVLSLLDLDHVHVVASSFGGWLASELAILEPGKFKSLTLMAPVGMFPRVVPENAAPPTRESFTRMIYFDQSMADKILARSLSEKEAAAQQRNAATTARYIGKPGYNPQLGEKLQQLRLPAFVVWGENDNLVPVAHAARWGEALRAKTNLLPKCGHLPHVELADKTGNWILSQLAQISAASSPAAAKKATSL